MDVSMYEKEILAGEATLKKLDPAVGKLIDRYGPMRREPRADYFVSLSRSIVSQQISVKAAASIYQRFTGLTNLDPAVAASLDETQIKAIGLSAQKARYIKDLAEHFVVDAKVFDHLDQLSDDAVIKELTAVKGIGIWTAQMFLMFTLLRLDIFPVDDVGIQRAMMRLNTWETLPPNADLQKYAEKWRPCRTIACWYLWASLDNEPKPA